MDKVKIREISWERERDLRSPVPSLTTDSKDSFWNSYPLELLTPEQREHFKTIMRKEVKGRVAE